MPHHVLGNGRGCKTLMGSLSSSPCTRGDNSLKSAVLGKKRGSVRCGARLWRCDCCDGTAHEARTLTIDGVRVSGCNLPADQGEQERAIHLGARQEYGGWPRLEPTTCSNRAAPGAAGLGGRSLANKGGARVDNLENLVAFRARGPCSGHLGWCR